MNPVAWIIVGFALGVAVMGFTALGTVAWFWWRERSQVEFLRRQREIK